MSVYDEWMSVYDEWMSVYDEWMSVYDEWMSVYDEWMSVSDEWMSVYDEWMQWVYARIWMVSVNGECWVNVGVKGCPKIDKKNKIFCHVTLQIIMCDNIHLLYTSFWK